MGAVFFREIRSLFRSIYAIVSITVFALASGIFFVLNNVRLGYPSIDSIIATLSLIAAVTIPVVACLSINLDRKKRNDEYLATLPLTRTQIVLGKFFAMTAFFAIPTAVVCLYPVILGFFGKVSYSYAYAAIFFLFVFELLLIALSMAFSAIFKKIWASLVVTYSVLTVSFLLGAFSIVFPEPLRTVVRFVSPLRRFDTVVYGKLDIPTLVFYALFAALLLAICIRYSSPKNSGVKTRFKLSLSCAVLSVIVLGLSVAVAFLPASLRWIDITPNKLYKTDSNTKQLLTGLDEEINVYLVDADGSEEKLVGFIERYCDRSSHIKFEKVDTSKDTEFRDKYGFAENANLSFCIVVESERRHTVIGAEELFVWYNANYADLGYMSAAQLQNYVSSLGNMLQQYSAYYSQMSNSDKEQFSSYMAMYESLYYYSARYLNAETELNEAIEYVTSDVIPALYFADGHGEKNSYANPLDITKLSEMPKDAGMLIINTPDSDYSEEQIDMLLRYMEDGGRILVFADANNASMPNLARLLASVGLSLDATPLGDSVKAVVNTSSDVFAGLATNETLKLDMIAPTEVKTEAAAGYEYTSLFTYDVEEQVEKEGENGESVTETKVVTKNIGLRASKGKTPVLTLVSGSGTFNLKAADLGEDEEAIKNYSVSVTCLGAMVSSMNRSFEPSVESSTPKQYDTTELLAVTETSATVVGTLVIALIPMVLLGAGLLNLYTRKKRGNRTV
ncbi:MAG: hypothetical protein E7642_06655 [Ruminococcaceae bacterium]|nr:hypothetical protein [Oscillospiraceae bacterium]